MRTNKLLPHIILTAILLLAALIINAASHGQIKGWITDSQTGKPIHGVSVLVVGTNTGVMTDIDGFYNIRNVKPGKYSIRFSHIEYNSVSREDVEIKPDLTTEVNTSMTKKTLELEGKSTATSERDKIDNFEAANQVDVLKSAQKMSLPPIKGVKKEKAAYYAGGINRGIYPPPAHGGTAIVNGEPFDAMFFENYGTNPFVDTEDDNLSTFAIDVDDASFVMARSYLDRGYLPPKDAVRTEEFINRFDYNYPAPHNKTFDVFIESAPSKFGTNSYLLKVGIKGREIRPENRKPANLVFVIDISGSMDREDRLETVKKALMMLVEQLRPSDKVGIVVYGSSGNVLLEPTSIRHERIIIDAISRLRPGGSTNAEEGLRLGYQMANHMFDPDKTNRIILCSDGVANVGITKAETFLEWISGYAQKGITLSSIGFGMGNFNDVLLEKLGNKGNGSYAYVDDLEEARRIFVDNLTGTLEVIACDVKIQMEFDPRVVRSYRLLGYENRDVADKDFRNDQVDGGEIGSGHSVTALYEIKLTHRKAHASLGSISIRYKDPSMNEIIEIKKDLPEKITYSNFNRASRSFKLAACAAEFAEILRESYWAKGAALDDVLETINSDGHRCFGEDEFVELEAMIIKARAIKEQLAEK